MSSCPLLLMLAFTAGPSDPPLFGAQDIVPIIEALQLEDEQQATLNLLIRDFGQGWFMSGADAAEQVQSGPAWEAFTLAKSHWQEAQAKAKAAAEAKRTARNALMAGGPKIENAGEVMAEAVRVAQAARDGASTARHRMMQLRRKVDPDQSRMRKALHRARAPLEAALQENIQILLTPDQLEQWPGLRQRLLRARLLRSLDIPGANIDLRGMVLRRQKDPLPGVNKALTLWSKETDTRLEAIHLASAAAASATEAIVQGTLWLHVMQLQSDLADLTLEQADLLAREHASFNDLARFVRHSRFPLSGRPTEVHQLVDAAQGGTDAEVSALTKQALQRFEAAAAADQTEWETTEADMQTIEFACRHVGKPSDEHRVQRDRSKTAVARVEKARTAMAQDQLQWLVSRLGAERLIRAFPAVGIQVPEQVQQTDVDAAPP